MPGNSIVSGSVMILAPFLACANASGHEPEMQLVNESVKPQTIRPSDQQRLSCAAARQAYKEQKCDKTENGTQICEEINADLKDCEAAK